MKVFAGRFGGGGGRVVLTHPFLRAARPDRGAAQALQRCRCEVARTAFANLRGGLVDALQHCLIDRDCDLHALAGDIHRHRRAAPFFDLEVALDIVDVASCRNLCVTLDQIGDMIGCELGEKAQGLIGVRVGGIGAGKVRDCARRRSYSRASG